MKRLCSPRLAKTANGNIVTIIGTSNEAAYQIGMTAHFVCNPGYYHANDWHHQEKAVICLTTDDNASQKWMPVDGSSLVPCVKGMKNIFVFEFIDIKFDEQDPKYNISIAFCYLQGARPTPIVKMNRSLSMDLDSARGAVINRKESAQMIFACFTFPTDTSTEVLKVV